MASTFGACQEFFGWDLGWGRGRETKTDFWCELCNHDSTSFCLEQAGIVSLTDGRIRLVLNVVSVRALRQASLVLRTVVSERSVGQSCLGRVKEGR